MRNIFIGDVHGCTTELRALINRLALTADDHVTFLGDLIDKGPDSPGAVQLARSLTNKCQVTLILGNHEEKFLRWYHHTDNMKSRIEGHENFLRYQPQLTANDIDWLHQAVLSEYYPALDLVAVHGGFPAAFTRNPEYTFHDTRSLSSKDRKHVLQVCRTRFLDEAGKFVGRDDLQDTDVFWANTYAGLFGHAIFGHEPFVGYDAPAWYDHATGIDLGCVFGGFLCALIYEEDTYGFARSTTRVTVKALKQYCTKRGE